MKNMFATEWHSSQNGKKICRKKAQETQKRIKFLCFLRLLAADPF